MIREKIQTVYVPTPDGWSGLTPAQALKIGIEYKGNTLEKRMEGIAEVVTIYDLELDTC